MTIGRFIKDPQAVEDYNIDWSNWLAAKSSDTISSSSFAVPAGLTKGTETFTNTVTTVWLSGGTAGRAYDIVNTINTAGGRTEERTFTVQLIQR